jgi:hypothetical protein
MNNLPAWIPNINAWMSSLLIVILARGLGYVFQLVYLLLDYFLPFSLREKLIVYSFFILSPIVLIAVVHHWLHFILDRFFPNTRSPEIGKVEGFFPGLISWWEGFFGWQALAIATLISGSLFAFFLPPEFKSLDNLWDWWYVIKPFLTVMTLIQLIVIAYLYQFESIVRNYLISVGKSDR